MLRVSRKSVVWLLVLLIALLAWQVISYCWLAHRQRATVICRFLPQYTHIRGFKPKWACISNRTWFLDESQRAALDSSLRRHVPIVYWGEGAIPAEYRKPGHYVDGFLTGMQVRNSGPYWFVAEVWDHEASLAARGRTATFVWVLGRWMHVWTSNDWIS